jgi:hypothetical protein
VRLKFFAAMTGVALVGSGLAAGSAGATTITAGCTGTVGNVASLAAAIDSANTIPGPDTVQLGAGCTYRFTVPDFDNGWYGPNALPPIASDVTIEGNGATLLRDAAASPFRFFFVGADPAAPATLDYFSPGAGRLTLRNLTLRGGLARGGGASAGGGGAGMGGAIFNQGQLVIEASTLVGNTAQGGAGGAPGFGNGGGGMSSPSNTTNGGGMGASQPSPQSPPQGGTFGPAGGGAGGGAGFRVGDNGANPSANTGGAGGGGANGMAGRSGSGVAAGNGGGGGGGGTGAGTLIGGFGGDFGDGGIGTGSGGGGGVGGGGGSSGNLGATGGGGGFGGGGGWGIAGGGSGGFGGGAGATGSTGSAGAPGFGGGAAQTSPGRGGGGAGFGGAVFNMQGMLTVRNSTFTQDSAVGGDSAGSPDPGKGFGGAVFNLNGVFAATGATFAANSATPNTVNAEGSSIYNLAYDGATARAAQATLRNTIVDSGTGDAGLVSNKSTFITPANLGAANATLGADDIVRTSVTADGGAITGTALTTDPLLGPLADNGGPTLTMAPAASSPAIDAGSASGLTTDQRGLPRPSNILEVPDVSNGADIGAVEVQGPGVFGTDTGVRLKLAKKKVRARGPVPVKVINSNAFRITGKLSGKSAKKIAARPGAAKKHVRLKASKIAVGAATSRTVRLKLPRSLSRLLVTHGRLTIRLSAKVTDETGTTKTVTAKVTLKLKKPKNSH